MTLSRRDAIASSASAIVGLSLATAMTESRAQNAQKQPQEPWPDHLVERPKRPGFPADLPLNADGSAPEHPASEAGAITGPLMWRTSDKSTPAGESDYRKMA